MGKTERLTIDLPSHLVAGLRESVRSGAYRSESAAIEELLLAWYGPEGTKEPPIEQLRAFVAEGIADADAGRLIDADEVFDELEARYEAMIAKRDQ
ncbi:MAG: type II toxin-antitoxin system ParD family antitoxin [Xanthobacteraceae bacterium]|jgi:antitoxin ParD1/3/4